MNQSIQELEAVIPAPVVSVPNPLIPWLWGLPIAAALWSGAYAHLADFADLAVATLGLSRETRLGEAVHFFLYDTPKVLLLLVGVVLVMGVLQTFFAPERTRALLADKRLGIGNALAASPGYRHPLLLLLGGAPLHRICLRRRAPGCDLLVPDCGAHGQ